MAIYSVGTFRKSAFAVVLVASLSALNAAAQIQNPIQAAKDAYNKAKQQNKPKQPAPQDQETQAGNAPVQSSATADGSPAANSSPEALKKIAASSQFLDIVGGKVSMTP